MIILSVGFLLLVIGILAFSKSGHYDEIWGIMLAAVGGMLLFVSLILLPIHRYETRAKIIGFNAVAELVDSSQGKDNTNIRNAAMYLKVAELNAWLAEIKYWNKSIFDIWIPDEIEKLEPIR